MILVCPSCDTRYFADDSAVGKEGRRVRCASCGHSWFAKVQDDGDVAVAEDTGLTREQVERLRQTAAANSASRSGPHSEYRAREHARRKRNRTAATLVAWAGGFLIFAMAAGAAVVLRNQIVETWPKTASIYRAVGLDVNRFGLEFVNVSAKRSFDGTTPVLTVTGAAVNKGKTRRASPEVKVSLKDDHGKEVQTWTDHLSTPFIGPGESVPFTSRFVAPPLETYGLSLTFASSDAGASAPATVEHDQIQGTAPGRPPTEPQAGAAPAAEPGAAVVKDAALAPPKAATVPVQGEGHP